MDAVSVWVEYLREQAVQAQRESAFCSFGARAHRRWPEDARCHQAEARRAGIIAREAYRQWAAAMEAAPYAKRGRMAGNATTYSGMGQCLMALERAEP